MSVFDWNASLKPCILLKLMHTSKTNDVFNIENKLNLMRTHGAFQIDAEDRHLVATVESITSTGAALSCGLGPHC